MQVHRDLKRFGPQRGRAPSGHPGPGEAEPQARERRPKEEEEAEAVRQREEDHQTSVGYQKKGEVLREPTGAVSVVRQEGDGL